MAEDLVVVEGVGAAMSSAEVAVDPPVADPQAIIMQTITTLLERRGALGLVVEPGAKLTTDLGIDSLELAELSAVLEDEIGYDPYSDGVVPQTVGELIAYYDG